MRRFPCSSTLPEAGEIVTLSPEDSHHLLRVNLTPRGTEVLLYSPDGLQARALLVNVVDDIAHLEMRETPSPQPTLMPKILLIGQPKKPALEHILRMATELGCTEIRVFEANRSIARGSNVERWLRVTEGCLSQCGRTSGPVLSHHTSLDSALRNLPEEGLWICLPTAGLLPSKRPEGSVVLVGPEGGLSPAEVEAALQHGFQSLRLGHQILRCDTAAAAALGLLTPLA